MQRTAIAMLGSVITRSVEVLDRAGILSGQTTAVGSVNARLADYVRQDRNHRKVKRSLLKRHKTNHGASVAFVAAALRQIGVLVPQDGVLDGQVIARISLALSRYLQQFLDWKRIDDVSALRPGDVVFTEDAHCCPGIPARVFVFLGWSNRDRFVASIADDQGVGYAYPLRSAAPDASPFAYALRG